jgi:HNH endonuclease
MARPGRRPRHIPVDQLFWAIVEPVLGDNRCWPWPRFRYKAPWDYGAFTFQGQKNLTHRVAWLLTYGSIPHGMFVCHTCENATCCRPSHLFLGTALENRRGLMAKSRTTPLPRARKHGRWAVHYPACVTCGTTEKEHKAKGLCVQCYSRARPPKTTRIMQRLQKELGLARWAKHYDACVQCHGTDSPCAAYGRCKRCYYRR